MFSDKVENTNTTTGAPTGTPVVPTTPTTPPAPPTPPTGGGSGVVTDKKQATTAFLALGTQTINNMTSEEISNLGSKRKTVSFINTLGDPTVLKGKKEGKENVAAPVAIGATFQCSEEVTVTKITLAQNSMSTMDTVGEPRQVTIPANTPFVLNMVETAMFLGRPEYSCQALGGSLPVRVGYQFCADASDSKMPIRAILRVVEGMASGSPRDNIVPIATKNADGTWVLREEYKADFETYFHPELKATKGTRRKGSSTAKADNSAKVAASFRKYFSDIYGIKA